MAIIDHFPAAIFILRDRTDLSQRATADRVRERTGASLTQAMLSQWERGTQRPAVESLTAFLDGLDYSLADLHWAIIEAEEKARIEEGNPTDAEAEILDQVRSRLRAEPAFRDSLLVHLLEPVDADPSLHLLGAEIGDLRQALDERMLAIEKKLAQLITT